MNKLSIAYWIGLVCLACYPGFGLGFAVGVFFVSLLLALVPLATTKFFFALPIVILIYCFCTGHSTFAWWCIVYIPFHYVNFFSNIIDGIKNTFN